MRPGTRMLYAVTFVICFISMISPELHGERDSSLDKYRHRGHDHAFSNRYAYNYSAKRKYRRKKKTKKYSRKLTYCKKRRYYRVRRGDNLYKIARKFRVSFKSLCRINRFSRRYKVKTGQRIKIPRCKKYRRYIKKRPRFRWPVRYVRHYKRDGARGIRNLGIIIKGRSRNTVLSSANGVVKRIGRMRGFGNYIVIKHRGRYTTVYAHLKKISVSKGERLRRGQKIGTASSTLHFQIDYAGKPLNPLKYLPRKS